MRRSLRRVQAALALVMALSFAAVVPAQAASAPEIPPPVHFTLDNGLEVVVIEDRRAPVITQMLWYRVGSADDPVGLSGMAHYVEHLMFKATETRDEGEFDAILRAQGARSNAFTSFDYTAYFQTIAADRLEIAMQLESERMAGLRIDRSAWLTERDVILEERGQTLESQPNRVMAEQLRATLFRHHPYGIHPLGWRHEMALLDGETADAFYRAHYGPNNAVLILAGDIGADTARELAERHYGPIPANPDITPRERRAEPPQLAERRLILRDERVAQPSVNRLYLAPTRRAGDQREAAAMQVMAALLGGTRTSVLDRRLVHEDEIALSVWASYSGTALDHGTFSLGAVPAEGVSLAEVEAALDSVLAEFIESGIDAEQLERVRRQLRAWAIYELDEAQSRARSVGAALTTGLGLVDVTGWIETLLSIEEDEIMAAARALDRRASVTGWLTSEEGEAG